MGTKWSHTAYLAALIAGVATAAASCSDRSTGPTAAATSISEGRLMNEKRAALQQRSGWTGDYHNRALDHVYHELRKQNAREMSKSEKCKAAEIAFKEFNAEYRRNGKPLNYRDFSFGGTVCDDSNGKRPSKQLVLGPGSQVLRRSADLSAPAASLFSQLEGVFDAEVSLSVVVSTIQDIENTAAATLDETEAGALIAAAEVAISSAEYWDANLEDWEAELSSDPSVRSNLQIASPGLSTTVGSPTGAPLSSAGLGPLARRLAKVDLVAALGSILLDWWMGPIAIEKAVIKGAVASLLAGLFDR